MEAKILLRLIKEDITHLEEITGEFILNPLPSPDEVELALVRAKALLRELELLCKYAFEHESSCKVSKPVEEVSEQDTSEHVPFEVFDRETRDNEQLTDMVYDQEHQALTEEVQDIELSVVNQQKIEEESETSINDSPTEVYFTPLTEPAESEFLEPLNPIVNEEEIEEHFTTLVEPVESEIPEPEKPIVNEEIVNESFNALTEPVESEIPEPENPIVNEEMVDKPFAALDESAESSESIQKEVIENSEETTVDQESSVAEETNKGEVLIVSDIPEHKEEILAEEFKEEKKTLNETLGESYQLVNDILSPEKSESGYQITSINSIWDGIGINDRFLFIRELFANSSAKFETTMAALDKLATIQDAVSYLKMNFKWNKTEASHKFLDLVKRRFAK